MIDTHAHIHSRDYPLAQDTVINNAQAAGLVGIVCVGTDIADSRDAITLAQAQSTCSASIGVHPHHAKEEDYKKLEGLIGELGVVAVGECGLDYYYENSPRDAQKAVFRFQVELALKHDKPLIFHIRDQRKSDGTPTAFDDFFEIVDKHEGIKGVIHSFTSGKSNVEKALERGLYIGLNGIMTFTKDAGQLEAAKAVPLENLLLETDSPFLAPHPWRGRTNEPANVKFVADFLAELRSENPDELYKTTTQNAKKLFSI